MKVLDILTAPWALLPERYVEFREIYLRHTRGEKADLEALEPQLGKPLSNESSPYSVELGLMVIELQGIFAKRMNRFTQITEESGVLGALNAATQLAARRPWSERVLPGPRRQRVTAAPAFC